MRFSALALCALFFCAGVSYAAEISNVVIKEINDDGVVIEWKTDTETDATVNFGLDSRVGVIRDPQFNKKTHSVTIDDLEPATRYFFSVTSADPQGNKTTSSGYVFTTKSPNNTAAGKDAAKNPPTIMGSPKVVTYANTVEISWSTDRESNSVVHFVPESEYSATSRDPYTRSQGNRNEQVTKHKVVVEGLEPSTVYHFKVVSEDGAGLAGETADDTFRTKSLLPEITRARVGRIQESSAVVEWQTEGVKTKGVVEYKNLRTNAVKSAGNAIFATSHQLLLAGLELGTRYSATIVATNEAGESVSSNPLSFVTVRDIVPPLITKVKNESTLFPGEEVKIQTIFAWETDEPSTCTVFYTQGLIKSADGEGDSFLPPETNPVTMHTQVIVGFASATVYKFWVVCEDPTGNESQSEDFVLITPVKEKSIIDLILENFEGTFGWVKNIGK